MLKQEDRSTNPSSLGTQGFSVAFKLLMLQKSGYTQLIIWVESTALLPLSNESQSKLFRKYHIQDIQAIVVMGKSDALQVGICIYYIYM